MPRNDKPRSKFGKGRPAGGDAKRPAKRFSKGRAASSEVRSERSEKSAEGRAGKPFKKRFSTERKERVGEEENFKKPYIGKSKSFTDRKKRLSSERSEERGENKHFGPREDRPKQKFSERSPKKHYSERPEHAVKESNPKMEKIERNKPERIAKFIARCGVASRRDAERLIEDGSVQVNGKRITSPALNVTTKDIVTVNGKRLQAEAEARLFLYYKPVGLMTTHKDPEGRETVFSSLPKAMPRVVSVGRLDVNSEGLLLLTTSGEIAHQLENPKQGWKRRYRVRAYGKLTDSQMNLIRKGITIDDMDYRAAEIEYEGRKEGKNAWYTITITEGKNREIRRIFEYFDCRVSRLIRVSFGAFQLGTMKPGEIKEVPLRMLQN